MKHSTFFAITTIFVVLGRTASPLAADSEPHLFDTAGFLSSCTGFVPDVDYALPMDTQCISQAVRMCNLSHELQVLKRCVDSAAAWMETDSARIITQMPGFDMSVFDDNGLVGPPLSALGEVPDCTKVSDPNLSSETVCRYSEALSHWLKLRILMRSDGLIGEASQ
ncbi:hypothetical protein L0Z65_08420 [Phaeobacter sp. BS52]|uniref:hypothetical protein n=1 Tax=Phaeobacter sp. BS52 TaxID=2907241 RepID=UPI00386F47A0